MAGEAVATVAPKKTADERIAECPAEGRSFVFDAGVGAGKTYSLVEGLKELCAPTVVDRLRRDGQQIACITYTNMTKDQVIDRIQDNSLMHVSTIHDSLQGILQPHQQALRQTLSDFNIAPPTGSLRRIDQVELAARIVTRLEVKYSDRSSKFLEGQIYHDDLLSIARITYTKYDKLARIVTNRYPYIFIDRYQDTSEVMIDILLCWMLPPADNKLVLESFGGRMQDIRHHGEHRGIDGFPAELIAPLEVIVKRESRRYPLRVVDMLNNIRTDVTQIPGDDDA